MFARILPQQTSNSNISPIILQKDRAKFSKKIYIYVFFFSKKRCVCWKGQNICIFQSSSVQKNIIKVKIL